jgi:effector-binding domain-containing protein
MKILRRILLVLLAVIVILIAVAYLLPSKVCIKRKAAIKAPRELVYFHVNYLKSWEKWSPWHKMDTTMKITYSPLTLGKGAFYAWESKNEQLGTGKYIITEAAMYDSICNDMYFMNSPKPTKGGFRFKEIPEGTEIVWWMQSDLGYNPFMRWMGLFFDKMVGKDFEKGLSNLKTLCEGIPSVKVEAVSIPKTIFISIRDTSSMATIGPKMGQIYGELMAFLTKSGAKEIAPPFTIYHSCTATSFDMECGIPVDKVVKPEGRIQNGEMKATNAVVADYYGPYDGTDIGQMAVMRWIKANNKKNTGICWESYITDPMAEKNPDKILTKVYMPIE